MFLRDWKWWKLYTKVKPLLNVARTEDELRQKGRGDQPPQGQGDQGGADQEGARGVQHLTHGGEEPALHAAAKGVH